MNTTINPELRRRFETIAQITGTEMVIHAPCEEGQKPDVSYLLVFNFLQSVIPKIFEPRTQATQVDSNYFIDTIRTAAELHLLTSQQFAELLDELGEEQFAQTKKTRAV